MAVQSSLPVGVYCTVAELSVTFLEEPPGANAREMSGSGLSPGLLVGGHVE